MTDQVPGTKLVEVAPPPPPTTVALPPVAVTVIGTKGDAIPADGTIATVASPSAPNVQIRTITPFIAVLIRFCNNFSLGMAGSLGAVWGTGYIPFTGAVDGFRKAFVMTLIVVIPVMLKDVATAFSGLEKKYPLATGSI